MTPTAYYSLPDTLAQDIETYADEVNRFVSGEMDGAHLRARRVPRGVYEQRRDGTYMVRVRIAGGTCGAEQARALAAISREFGNALLHITSRQDIQFHDVAITDTPQVMRRLLEVGLTSKGGGGNTVRNVTACPYAGICPAERFDVTSCAHAVTEYLIPLTGSYNLPRKYKIAFSGCPVDCALAQVADLGFIAEVRDGQPGFRVLAGGGMGAQSRIADPLLEWAPASDIIRISETVRRLFDELGERTNKHRARLRYVYERLGAEAFTQRFTERADDVVAEGVPQWHDACPPHDKVQPLAAAPQPETHAELRVVRQRQEGLVAVCLHAPLGFLHADDLEKLSELAARFSNENGLRTTIDQNLLLRGVRESDLPALALALRGLRTDVVTPQALDRFTACAGAATCRLGICLARQAAKVCGNALDAAGVARETLDALPFNINGCTNACGQQPIAVIGFFGMTLRAHDRLLPAYGFTLGGRCDASGARFGDAIGKVPAAALPALLCALAVDFEAERTPDETFAAYYDRKGSAPFKELAARHAVVPDPETHPEYYRDHGTDEPFSLAGRGAGECGAGVFDVIASDLAAARKAVAPGDILTATARALLITRGVDAHEPDAVFRAFEHHFIDSGLVDASYRALLDRGRGHLRGWKTAFDGCEAAILALRERVELLYKTLDANLQFHPPVAVSATASATANETAQTTETAEIDLRGVGCPLNFVKAKLRLEALATGETLHIILDDGDPIRNVPGSLRGEGHTVDDLTDLGDGHWRIRVCKA